MSETIIAMIRAPLKKRFAFIIVPIAGPRTSCVSGVVSKERIAPMPNTKVTHAAQNPALKYQNAQCNTIAIQSTTKTR